MNLLKKIQSLFNKEQKCSHDWIEIISLPLTKEFRWTESVYVGDGQYSDISKGFTGTAFLVFNYCPKCMKSSYVCASPYEVIPYTEYYINHLMIDILKETDPTNTLDKLLISKCNDHDYIWDEINGRFNQKIQAPTNINQP